MAPAHSKTQGTETLSGEKRNAKKEKKKVLMRMRRYERWEIKFSV
jgi:hypothetical protein